MKFACEVDIHVPRSRVVELLDDPSTLQRWQTDLIRFEPIAGEPGAVGSTSRLVYRAGKGEMEMIETIVDRAMPDGFTATYAMKMGTTTIRNRFDDLGDSTRWTMDSDYAPAGLMRLLAPLLGGVMRKESLKRVNAFKAFAEANPA